MVMRLGLHPLASANMKQISRKRRRKMHRMALRRRGIIKIICGKMSLDETEFIHGISRAIGGIVGLPYSFSQ